LSHRLFFVEGKNIVGTIIVAIFLFTGIFGCAESIEHDSKLASKRAVEFAEATFVRRNLDKGYALLADKARSYVPMEKFNEKVAKMHPNGHPGKVTAVNAVAVPGERIVNVSLRGEGSAGAFDYAVTLVGTAATDYRVSTFAGGRSS
jgi:hypothetical protein